MHTSVYFPVQPHQGRDLSPFADLVARGDAHRLWMGTSLLVEAQQSLAYLAGTGYRIPTGTAVQLAPLRHPLEAAVEARSLALLSGRPVVAGFGSSSPAFVSYLNGAPYERPATAVRDYLARMREFLDSDGGALPPAEHPEVELAAGVLRPGMARAAGEVADVAVTWMTPPRYVREALVPALTAGAGASARRPRVATVVPVAVDRAGRDMVRIARLAAAGHLAQTHYVDMLRRAGLDLSTAEPMAAARSLITSDVFVTGSPERIAGHLQAYAQAGVDEVILNTGGVLVAEGIQASVQDTTEIAAAMGAQEPARETDLPQGPMV